MSVRADIKEKKLQRFKRYFKGVYLVIINIYENKSQFKLYTQK